MRNNVMKGKGCRTKLTFCRRGFDWRTEAKPRLVVVATPLDGDAPKIISAPADVVFIPSREAPGIMAGIDIPSAGCWEVTAHHKRFEVFIATELRNGWRERGGIGYNYGLALVCWRRLSGSAGKLQ